MESGICYGGVDTITVIKDDIPDVKLIGRRNDQGAIRGSFGIHKHRDFRLVKNEALLTQGTEHDSTRGQPKCTAHDRSKITSWARHKSLI